MPEYRRASVPGAIYFFTLTLADRSSRLLMDEIDRLRSAYAEVQQSRPFETVAISVMPEHLHAVWALPHGDPDYSTRWAAIKALFSRGLTAQAQSSSQRSKREKGLWQRRFWEHLIRDEDDLQRHVDYIHYNPVKHGLVPRAADWPHSSFHRYVRDGLLPPDWGTSAGLIEGSFGE